MKLTAKLVVMFVLGMFVVTALHAWISIQHEEEQFEKNAVAEVKRFGRMITVVLHSSGEQEVKRTIEETNTQLQRSRFRWANKKEHENKLANEIKEYTTSELHVYCYVDKVDSQPVGLIMSRSLHELRSQTNEAIYESLTLCGATVLMAGLIATLFGVRFVGQPLKQLTEKTRRIGKGDLSGPVKLNSRDEMGELAHSVNEMCEQLTRSQQIIQEEEAARLTAVDQLRHADRLRTVGRLASGLAHELGTPLNVVSGRAGLIASGRLSSEEVTQSAETIRTESERMTTIIRQLLDFARRSTPQRVDSDLKVITKQTIDLLTALAQKNNVTLSLDCPASTLPLKVDIGQMQQVLSNLVVNAIQSMPAGGQVTVKLDQQHLERMVDGMIRTGDFYCLRVQDQGTGIAEENIDQLFEPFFTTKEVGVGTGLGLSISYGIIQEHGGWFEVESQPDVGSCFSVYLPLETEVCPDAS
ncbi:MAG: HAMP domain-containing histidine kinase [Planctomycetales bacterium]